MKPIEHLPDKMPLVLAIDLGTSGPKAALVTLTGEVVASSVEYTRLIMLPHGGVEQDPEEWWSAICRAVRRLGSSDPALSRRIVAISCTGQWSGTVAVDREGNHLANAITWMDSRGAPHVARVFGGPLRLAGYGVDKLWHWIRVTGGLPGHSGKDSIAHILYIKHTQPALYAQTHKFLEPKDYLNLRLTGEFAASIDSITLHWVTDNRDIDNIHYHDRLLRAATLDREKLPRLGKAIDILGTVRPSVAEELGIPAGARVILGTPDMHSAGVGSGATTDYAAHLYVGTSSWLSCHLPFKKTDLQHNMATLPSALPGRYFLANEQELAGGCLTFLRDNLSLVKGGKAETFAAFEAMLSGTPAGNDRVIFTPWLNGERTPVDDHRLRGAFHNLSLLTTQADMVRAVYEGVAYNTRWLLGYVERFIKRPLPAINIVGGGALSEGWCQIFADVLQRPMRQVGEPLQVNARGAGLLAAMALDNLSPADIEERTHIARTFEPNERHSDLYDHLFGQFLALYKANRSTYGRLNRREPPDMA